MTGLAFFAVGGLILMTWTLWLVHMLASNAGMIFWLFVAVVAAFGMAGFTIFLAWKTAKESSGRYVHGPLLLVTIIVALMTVAVWLIVMDVWIGSSVRSSSLLRPFMPRGNLLDGGFIGWTYIVLFVLLGIALTGVAIKSHLRSMYQGVMRPVHTRTVRQRKEKAREEQQEQPHVEQVETQHVDAG